MRSPATRKQRGAFFTPPQMADFVVRWALRSPADSILEPSCGEAAFLLPTVLRLREMGATNRAIEANVRGAELHEPSVAEACRAVERETGVDLSGVVSVGDFFDIRSADVKHVDACVGNPPYIRYQSFSGEARRKGREAALAQGVAIDGLSSSWAPFTVHAASFLKPGGRLGLVLPAELLSVNYAAPVRRYLLERFGCVRVVLFEERVFPGVLEEVVLLLAEGTGPCDKFDVVQVRDLDELEHLNESRWSQSPTEGKWTGLLLPEETRKALRSIENTKYFTTLGAVATVSIGMVTGANQYFCLSEAERRAWNLSEKQVLKIMPPGSKHSRGILYDTAAWEHGRSAGSKTWLFCPSPRLSDASKAYVSHGEALKLNDAYKCRVRKPWYRVPLVGAPDLFMVYMANEGPRFLFNQAGCRNVNSVHGVYLRDPRTAIAMSVATLSTVSLLSAELSGRAYGGGLLKLEPREALQVAVPTQRLLERCAEPVVGMADEIQDMLKHGGFEDAVAKVDQLILAEELGLDANVLDGLRAGREHLYGRRRKRGQG